MDITLKPNFDRLARRRSRLIRRVFIGVALIAVLIVGAILLARYLGWPQAGVQPGESVPLTLPPHPGAPSDNPAAQSGRTSANATDAIAAQALPSGAASPSWSAVAQAPNTPSLPTLGPLAAPQTPVEPVQTAPDHTTSTTASSLQPAPRMALNAFEAPSTTATEAKALKGWLASRADDHYTIQLIAGYERQTLERFLEQHSLGHKAHVVQTQYQGRDWHILITGDYPSRDAAHNAMNRLPNALRDNGLWVRSFASLRP